MKNEPAADVPAPVDSAVPKAETSLASTTPPTVTQRQGPGDAARVGELPEQFGRYKILRKLGQGGMGSVYLAQDSQLDRPVALKVPHFSAADGPEILERFEREGKAAATLQHPNICPVHDVGEIDGFRYLTMSFIEGKPLSELARSEQRMSQRPIAAMVRKLALALAEAHRRGVVHRDLKPANVMVNRRQEPVIMDFGLARRLPNRGGDSGDDDIRLTKRGALMGTPAYMPPEQVEGNLEAMGPASDIYSLGVILYELLTGRLPFQGTLALVVTKILTQAPEPPSKHRPDVDPALEAICLKALAKKPGERYASMGEMATALGEYLKSSSRTSTVRRTERTQPAGTSTTPTEEGRDSKLYAELANQFIAELEAKGYGHRRLWPWIAASLGLLGLVVALAVMAMNRPATVVVQLRVEVREEVVLIILDRDEITRETLQQPLQLSTGDHFLFLKDDRDLVETQKFTVGRNDDRKEIPPDRLVKIDDPPFLPPRLAERSPMRPRLPEAVPVTSTTSQGEKILFSLGDISWVDRVVSLKFGDPAPTSAKDPQGAIGKPDYDETKDQTYVALGHGGELVLEFTDNRLIDRPGPDLAIFEIGPAVEPTEVAISVDGKSWVHVGRVRGAHSTLDIGPFVKPGERFRFVKLTDAKEGTSNHSDWPGADIDAVGAIHTVPFR